MTLIPQQKKFTKKLFAIFFVSLFVVQGFVLENAYATAGVPALLSYQGRLTDSNGTPLTGTYCVRYSIYDAYTSGTKLWPAGTPNATTTLVSNGIFSAPVGEMDTTLATYDFSANNAQYLNVEVNTTPSSCAGTWEALTPRQPLHAAPYARVAYSVYGGDVQVGDAGGNSGKLLKLAWKNTSDTLGGACTGSQGSLWFNSFSNVTRVCNNNIIKSLTGFSNDFFDITGPTISVKTFTFPDQNAVMLTNASAVTIAQGGTGQITATAAFDALSPLTTKGDLVVRNATNAVRFPIGTDGKVLTASSTSTFGVDWMTPAAGGGSPGGATTQIQFNNAGAFGGSANLTWDNTNNTLTLGGADTEILMNGITNEPAPPAAGTLLLYVKKIAGRMLPKMLGPSGVDTALQPALFSNTMVLWAPASGATGVGTGFGTVWTSAGTVTHPTPALTAPAITNQMKRTRYANAVTTTNQTLGVISTAAGLPQFWRGNAAGLGGFFFHTRIIIGLWPANTVRLFAGLTSLATAMTTADTQTAHYVGLWHDTTDGANVLSLVTMDGTTRTKTAIAGATVAAGQGFDFTVFAKPNDTTIYYRLVSINTGATIVDSSITTTLPANTAFMGPQVIMSNGTANITANTVALDINRIYVESDN